jgi:hypothetical protein
MTGREMPGRRVLGYSALIDAVGAYEPGFTARHALVGEWWLIQPVSPRLDHDALASRLRLELAGYLPAAHVDAAGRVVMACYPRAEQADAARAARLADSKWVAGWEKVTWTIDGPPLSDPAFALVERLDGVTETSYGPYRHSSELPEFPATAQRDRRSQQLARELLTAMNGPRSAERIAYEEQKQREDEAALEDFYVRSGQKPPKPNR